MQFQQKNVIAWSCPHQMYLPADLAYEVTQERGYCVTRLRSVAFLASPPFPSVRLATRKVRGNVIPFPQPAFRARVTTEGDNQRRVFAQIAPQKPNSSRRQERRAELWHGLHEKVAPPTLDEVLAALAENEYNRDLHPRGANPSLEG